MPRITGAQYSREEIEPRVAARIRPAVAEDADLRTGDATALSGLTRIATALRLIALAVLFLVPVLHTNAQSDEVEGANEPSQITPEWLTPESAAQLAVGVDVLLPEVVPAPFEGEPAITAYDGYYSLYWLIPSSPPTYLQINGELGGNIPDYSWYDRNVELTVNAEVQGYPAYHDLTPIYDLVYWQVGDVVYSVESSNLSDTDSLTLANNLALLAAGTSEPIDTPNEGSDDSGGDTGVPNISVPGMIDSGSEMSVEVSNANGEMLTASEGTFTDSGTDAIEAVTDGTFNWQAPTTSEDLYVRFLLIDPATGEWLAVGESTVVGTHIPTSASLECPTPLDPEVLTPFTLYGSGTISLEATGGSFPANWYNTQFQPDADGSAMLTGTVPASGAIELMWLAPVVDVETVFSIIARDVDGETLASCDITLIPYAPPTEDSDDQGGYGEGLPGGPVEEPTDVPIEQPREEPIEHPKEEPAEVPSEEPADDSVDDSTNGSVELPEEQPGEVIEAGDAIDESATEVPPDEPASTPRPTRTARATATAAATPSATNSPTPAATATPSPTNAPVTGPGGMVANVIGPEGGQLTHPAGATIVIPAGALSDEATVTIMSIEDSSLPVSDRVDFVPQTGFDIAIADATGRPIDSLAKPATLTIALKPDQWRRDTVLYWINESRPELLSDVELTDAEISAPLTHFSRFAAGVPITGNEGSNKLAYIIAAVVGILLVAVCSAVYSSSRRQRTLSVGPRRIPARHRRD